MRSDAEVHVGPLTDSAMQREVFLRFAAVAENGRAVRHRPLFVNTRAGVALVAPKFLLAFGAGSRGLIRVFFNVGPCFGTFRRLSALLFLNRLSLLFYFRFALLRGLLLLICGRRRLRADRQGNSEPHRY